MENILSAYADYVSKVGNEAYNQGVNLDGAESYTYGTNAVYAVLFDDNKLWRVDYHVCYGHLNELKRYAERNGFYGKPVAVFVQIQTPLLELEDFNEDMQLAYYEWLFNHSPYRHTFITKDYRKALKDKVVILDADAQANLLVGACSAIRCPWEYYFADERTPSIAKLWYELVTEGAHPDIAMALANNFSDSYSDEWYLRGKTGGHMFLKANRTNTIVNFIKGNHYITDSFRKLRGTHSGYGICGIWEKDVDVSVFGGKTASSWLKDRINGVSGAKVNPFGTTTSSQHFKLPALKEGLVVAARELKEKLLV